MGRAPWRGRPEEDLDDLEVAAALQTAEVEHLAHRSFGSLSGGEKGRASFARVLAQQTGILMLDEPTAALDLGHQETLLTTARERARAGAAVLVVLHDLTLAAAHADRMVVLEEGRVAATGTPHEVLDAALLTRVYRHPIEVVLHPRTGDPIVLADRTGDPAVPPPPIPPPTCSTRRTRADPHPCCRCRRPRERCPRPHRHPRDRRTRPGRRARQRHQRPGIRARGRRPGDVVHPARLRLPVRQGRLRRRLRRLRLGRDPAGGGWRPSRGGVTGRDYRYVPDSESEANAGYLRFVAFPGSSTAGEAQAVMSGNGSFTVQLTVPGPVFDASTAMATPYASTAARSPAASSPSARTG